ncbi:hypothetical protein ABT224_41165 [Streptomyces sp. NPDC001584]|uniref:hypothetical protein n=1 Tax=Streptomyces sp. NPDC001584 TaxID=3154521 RepID=UPI00331E9BFC
MNVRQFYGGIAFGLALSAAGWAVHHYGARYAGLRGPAAWTLLLAAVVVLVVTCVRMALGPTRPSGDGSSGALPGPRVPESDEVRSYAVRIFEAPQDGQARAAAPALARVAASTGRGDRGSHAPLRRRRTPRGGRGARPARTWTGSGRCAC